MALWHLGSGEVTSLRLWRTGEHTFRVIQYDEPVDVLTNYDYILLDRKYEPLLHQLGEQLLFTPVTVTDQVRQLVWNNYVEVKIKHSIDAEQMDQPFAGTWRIFSFDREHVFVSPRLKEAFQQVRGQQLVFSLGLSRFG
ncbi:hypothetical protein [Hymenobacter sp. GOD-10R]|uniref:hypothetical protein n=1 Tax=Hymenobacter sp. GOD-10R TaxID=3093922 RepID=UPI002D77065F|nr:hypothetical protein [Hymenobacter sp. GOD-10R]WRQ31869.1 hypothetical protein SD425_29435 [Hymenobacter sp. GOD-10R]